MLGAANGSVVGDSVKGASNTEGMVVLIASSETLPIFAVVLPDTAVAVAKS